jgi:D-glycero-alpha-D-manno-heptose-7-phosphate kinase
MIISKTPYRISFFGGGSDYPDWYNKEQNYGEVISTTINRYLYISCRELPPFFNHKFRICYSKIEQTKSIDEIKHIVVRKALKIYKIKEGLEIHYDGDMPSRSGVGSSSSFVVGLLNILNVYKSNYLSKKNLAALSVNFEHKVLKESVGSQDQIAVSYGGFNIIKMKKNFFTVKNLNNNENNSYFSKLNKNLVLVYTGQSRISQNIAKTFTTQLINTKKKNILKILDHVQLAKKIIKKKTLDDFGLLLNETWQEKRKLSGSISTDLIDKLYNLAIKNGALGGKILGAGGGGFLLFYVPQSQQKKFLLNFKDYVNVPFTFSTQGSKIILNNNKK